MTTILDASSEVAMSYEIYPDLLLLNNQDTSHAEFGKPNLSEPVIGQIFLREIIALGRRRSMSFLEKLGLQGIRAFLIRAERSGLTFKDMYRALGQECTSATAIADERLAMIASLASAKQAKERKSRWGAKCSSQFTLYSKTWPNASFINIIRDPRDVLASQQATGDFRMSARDLGRRWAETHMEFRGLVQTGRVRGLEVSYEELCRQPDQIVSRIFSFLHLDFSQDVLNYSSASLSIYRVPNGHLSAKRIAKPIDTSNIGRWSRELNEAAVTELLEGTGETFDAERGVFRGEI